MAGTFHGGFSTENGKTTFDGGATEIATQSVVDERFARLEGKFNRLVFWLAAMGFEIPDEITGDIP